VNTKQNTNTNGIVWWSGPSALDGAPIALVVVGLKESTNRKTGNMVQTYIIRTDMHPMGAVLSGADASICGGCPHRYRVHPDGKRRRTCYVNIGKGVAAVYGCLTRGGYLQPDARGMGYLAKAVGRPLRMGSYGDPAAVPLPVWQSLIAFLRPQVRTGYTHQWRDPRFAGFRSLCMASCDSAADVQEAEAAWWRAFHVLPVDAPSPARQVHCPSDPSGTVHVSCDSCGQCSGSGGRYTRSVWIRAHGPAKRFVRLATV